MRIEKLFSRIAQHICPIVAIIGTLFIASCSKDETLSTPQPIDRPVTPIVIIYENDVHCAVDGYAKLAALRNSYQKKTHHVATVSCGDFVQGNVVGTVTRGEAIIDIMNFVGYDVVTTGNHEFDFGIEHLLTLTKNLNADVVNANFSDLRSNKLLFEPYTIKRFGNVDIAFIGLTTPATMGSVAHTTFTDESGKVIYSFAEDNFYQNAQRHIIEARSVGADYVVILSHLGDSGEGGYPSSIDLIRNTIGIDAVLDAHDHNEIPDTTIINGAGERVLLSSTGSTFDNIGVLTLSTEGKFSSQLVKSEDCGTDERVQAYVEQIKEQTMAAGERIVGTSEATMRVKDESGTRITRTRETTIGNFCADAFRAVLGSDIAFVNGGAIRADISKGNVTYNNLLSVFPYNNAVCTATMSGSQIMDALEVSARLLPKENGGFLQVSGLRFKINTSVEPSVQMDESELFTHIGESRRVSDIQVLDKSSGEYHPIDPEHTYTIASSSFLIEDYGDNGILRYAQVKERNLGQDVDILAIYIEQILGGTIGTEYNSTEERITIE